MLGSRITITQDKVDEAALWVRVFEHFKAYCKHELCQNKEGSTESVAAQCVLHSLEQIDELDEESVLADFINGKIKDRSQTEGEALIFPFGCNKSQFEAVQMALKHSVSVIQGPPGTGKTQTILNLIANLLIAGKRVAVVSNNNDAVANVVEKLAANGLGWLVANVGNSKKTKDFFENQPSIELNPDWANLKVPKAIELQVLTEGLRKYYEEKIRIQQLKETYFQLGRQLDIFCEEDARDSGADLRQSAWVESLSLRSSAMLKAYEKAIEKFAANSGVGRVVLRLALVLLGLKPTAQMTDLKKTLLNALFAAYAVRRRQSIQAEVDTLEPKLEQTSSKEKQFFAFSRDWLYACIYEAFKGRENETFDSKRYRTKEAFFDRYPVLASSTYMLYKHQPTDKRFDYLIIDEASQVNLPTAARCFACASNVVIVGDSAQLPAILSKDAPRPVGDIPGAFDASRQNILSAVLERFGNALEVTTLIEHYRCHPDIIEFCNKQFYGGRLVAMTSREGREDPFTWVDMTGAPSRCSINPKNKNREIFNPRQIKQVAESYRTLLSEGCDAHDIGVITPYRGQADFIEKEAAGSGADTIHKYQGRERNVIIYSAVTNKPTSFNDADSLINVAVSRAKDRLILVSSAFEQYPNSNLAALVRYIKYLDPQERRISKSRYRSVFDSLFTGLSDDLKQLEGESPAEALFRELLISTLKDEKYRGLAVLREYPLRLLPRRDKGFSKAEKRFMLNNSRLDFLVYDEVSMQPVAAIEVDGQTHNTDQQKRRDHLKDSILEKLNLPLMRFATRSELGGEAEELATFLDACLRQGAPEAIVMQGPKQEVFPLPMAA